MNLSANGKYSIIAPGTLHSPGKYSVSVSVQDVAEPCQFRITINGSAYNESILVDLQANQLKKIEFNIPKLEKQDGDYELIAEGLKGLIFEHAAKLDFVKFLPHVMIQTNKHNYVPNEILHFRVIFTDENFRPIEPEKNTIVKLKYREYDKDIEYKTFNISSNGFCEKFLLPEIYGFWKIIVSVDEQMCTEMNFYVEYKHKYNIPQLKVNIKLDPHICIKDGPTPIVVKAFYTNNVPVNGKVTLKLDNFTDTFTYGEEREMELINGKATFYTDFREYEQNLSRTKSNFVHATADVEENLTGLQVTGTQYGKLYCTHYAAKCKNFQGGKANYKADEEFVMAVNINNIDGSSRNYVNSVVKLICEERRDYDVITEESSDYKDLPKELVKETFESNLNEAGIAVFKIKLKELTKHDKHYFELRIIFKDEEMYLGDMHSQSNELITPLGKDEETREYFEIKLQNEKQIYKNGDDLNFSIKSSKPLNYFIYNIIGRGNLLQSERVELPEAAMEHNLTIKSTFEMCPFGNIYIYYIDAEGTLNFAEQKFFLQINLENKLTISAPEVVKPDDEVELRIKTSANSFVGLLAVERRSDEYINYNDITYSIMHERLRNYFTQTLWQGSDHPGGSSGVVTLTNATYEHKLVVGETKKYEDLAHEHAYANGDAQVNDTTKEWNFQLNDANEVWIFDNIERTSSDDFIWKKRMPNNSLTTWHIIGFALHPEKGLALLEKPVKVKTFKPYHVFINPPHIMHNGGIIEVQALVYNFLQHEIDVALNLSNEKSDFDFLTPTHDLLTEGLISKALTIEPDAVAITHFLLKPRKSGDVLLEFHMKSSLGNELLQKVLEVLPAEKPQNFHELSVEIKTAQLPQKLEMRVSFTCFGEKYSYLEISLPTGYTMERPDLTLIEKNRIIQRNVELKNENTLIIAQVSHCNKDTERYSVPIWAYKSDDVTQQRPATIVMYEKENPKQKSLIYYQLPEEDSN